MGTVTYAAPSAQGTVMYSGGVGGGQETVTHAAPSAQGTVTYSGGVGGGQDVVTYAAPSAQGTVMYSGVGGGQETVTYAAPSAQGTAMYSGGVGSAAPQTLAYAAPQLVYNAQGQLALQTSTVSAEQQLIDANLLFDRLDINGDGVISRDEFARLVSGAVYVSQS